MEFRGTLTLPTATQLALSEYLRETHSHLTLHDAAIVAIDAWLAANRPARARGDSTVLRGYQWKTLFLPDGTDLRMLYDGNGYYAHVRGDHLMYQGLHVSPRQFTRMVASGVRNAWRDIFVREPGARDWKRASDLRRERVTASQRPPESPADTIHAAAACMSDALNTALKLVEHANAQSAPKFDRRYKQHRRENDLLADQCNFD